MQKTFRLFVSSTFSDFNEERILLQTKVFPEIKKYCSQKGLNFQPIDLRWGVSAEAQLDQKTLELCLNEVRSSKVNPHPNFLIMAGDRYGWIPLPYLIEQNEFESILDQIENEEDKNLLENWYKLDLNQIPASYILSERKGEFEDYDPWEEVENRLRTILQTVVTNLDLKPEEKSKYFTSATEAEVIEGIFKYLDKTPSQNELLNKDETQEQKDYDHVYAYVRNIDSIDDLEDKFKDVNPDDVKRFKKTLKESIKQENLFEVNANLTNVKQDKSNYSLNYKYQELDSFVEKIKTYLENSINSYLANIEDITPQELEAYEQNRFKNDKLKDFLPNSRNKALETIDSYINSNETQALVIYGKSGLGKSSLMAKCIEKTIISYQSKKIIYRFTGSTANLSTSVDILISILNELGIKEEIRKVQNPQTLQEEPEKIEEFYYRIHDHFKSLEKEIVIFLDAIDQVNNEDNFLWLPQNLPSNLKFIISALDDGYYEEDSKYFENLKTKSNNLYQLQKFDTTQSKELVNSMLEKYDRTIQSNQMEYLLKQEDSNSPLYLSVAVQELRHWKSSDKIIEEDENGQDLAPTQKEIIKEFISNLAEFYHHDKEFVKRVFSYLYLTQGLSESELLEVLNTDEEFIKEIAPDTYHENKTNELPIVIWARLHTQIKEFLKLEQKDNQETLSFFHREFNEVIKNQENIKETHEHLINLLQKLIIKHQDEEFDSNRWGKLYIEVVKDYHLEYEFDWLPNNSSKLKEYGQFLSKLKNENFQESIINNSYNLSIKFGKINKSKFVNTFDKFCLFPIQLLAVNSLKWLESYVHSLHKLSISLKSVEKISESIELSQWSLEITKKLYESDPSSWVDIYIKNLNILASVLNSVGKTTESMELAQESLNIIEKLYEKNQSIWAKTFTESLNNLGLMLSSIGKIVESIELLKKALKIRKELYKSNPLIYVNDYISTLNNLAYALSNIGKIDEAIEMQHKALNIIKDLYKENPNMWVETYTNTLNNLACFLKEEGNVSEMFKLLQESLEILEDLYKDNKERWSDSYITNLINLAYSSKAIGKIKDAIKLEKKSLKIIKNLYDDNPFRWSKHYITNLSNLGGTLTDLGELNEAIEFYIKAVEIQKEMYINYPQIWSKTYASNLNTLANKYFNLKNYFFSNKYYLEAVNIVKLEYQNNPDTWFDDYKIYSNNLANSLECENNFNEAYKYYLVVNELLILHYDKIEKNEEFLYSLNNLGNTSLLLKDFKTSIKSYEEYFNFFNMDRIIITEEKINWMIYPFVKYYQSFINLNKNLNELNIFINEKIEYLKNKFGSKYDRQIKIEYKGYVDSAKNSNLNKERLQIFEKLFINEDFS